MAESSPMASARVRRDEPLAGRFFGSNSATLRPASPMERISLRVAQEQADAFGSALGMALPSRIGESSRSSGGILAFRLGPDEWHLLAPDGADMLETLGQASMIETLRQAGIEAGAEDETEAEAEAEAGQCFSLVDVSHRAAAMILEGEGAHLALSSGCPRDLRERSFPVDCAARTILDRVPIILHREASQRFYVECWRSFSDWTWNRLVAAISRETR